MRATILLCAVLIARLASTALAFRDSGQVVNYAGFKYVTAIATSAQRTYVATSQGIIVFYKTENRWGTPLTGMDGIDDGTIKKIWVDQFDERLFAETDVGKYEYELTWGRWTTAFDIPELVTNDRHIPIPAVLFPPFGFDYDGNGGLIDPQGRKCAISDVVDDGAGTIWIGTWGLGLFRAGSASKVVEPLTFGLLQDAVYAMYEDDSVLYVAGPAYNSRRTGITALDFRTNSFRYVESGPEFDLPPEDIQCLDIAGDRLVVGTQRGLFDLDKRSGRVSGRIDHSLKIKTENFMAVRLVGDTIFAGTDDGLIVIAGSSRSAYSVVTVALLDHVIYDLEVVRDQVWIGSDIGAYRLSLATGKLQKYQDPDRLLFNRVFDITTTDHSLWLSSDGGAVQIDLDSGSTAAYRVSSRLIGDRAIAANDRIAALASDLGVTIIFMDGEHWSSRELSTFDGLLSPYVFALILDGDFLWVGTDMGLTRINWSNPRLRP